MKESYPSLVDLTADASGFGFDVVSLGGPYVMAGTYQFRQCGEGWFLIN